MFVLTNTHRTMQHTPQVRVSSLLAPAVAALAEAPPEGDYLAFKPLLPWQKRAAVAGVAVLVALGLWAVATQGSAQAGRQDGTHDYTSVLVQAEAVEQAYQPSG